MNDSSVLLLVMTIARPYVRCTASRTHPTHGPSCPQRGQLGGGPFDAQLAARQPRVALGRHAKLDDGLGERLAQAPVLESNCRRRGTSAPYALIDAHRHASRGHATLAVDELPRYEAADIAKVDILLNGEPVEAANRSSIVWTERDDLAPSMLALDDDSFDKELGRRFGTFLGSIEVVGPRWSYPLSLQFAKRSIDRRLVLIGDAAHGMHPIAGQGLNMGLRDVAALAEVLVDAQRLGLDIGDDTVLERYDRWRSFDNTMMLAATDGLNRLFSNDLASLKFARDAGLAAVDAIPPLKKLFMRYAMGVVGDLPKLLRGQPL